MQKVPKIDVSPAKRPRNGFDRSETHLYTQPAGMLLPVFQMFLNPHDHVSIDTTSIVQAQTLQGRPFLGMKQNFAFYFVPARLMCSYSKAFFSGVNPKNTLVSSSLAFDSQGGSKLKTPTFKPYQVFARFAGVPDADGHTYDNVEFGGSAATRSVGSGDGNLHFHQGGSFGGFRRGMGSDVGTRPPLASDVPSGTFEDKDIKKPFGEILAKSPGITDIFGYDILNSYIRFSDMMKYGAMPFIGGNVNVNSVTKDMMNYEANLYYWLAYQKIYQDHFLDTNYEQVNPRSYNVDDLYDKATNSFVFDFFPDKAHADRALDIFSPRYIKYSKDLLSNIHPSPLFIDDVSNTIKVFQGSVPNVGSPANSVGQMYNARGSSDTFSYLQWDNQPNTSTILSAAQLRNVMALDRMAQITSRAPKTYKGQMLAHYGVNVSDDLTQSFYVGGFQKALEVSPVIATADGKADDSSTNFGQQGSYIDSGQSGHVNFNAKEHGVLMCISWFSPSTLYDADGIDAFNVKFVREDYFVPETENLGMQPVEFSRLLPPWIKFSQYRLPDLTGKVQAYFDQHKDEIYKNYQGVAGNHSGSLSVGQALGHSKGQFDVNKVYGWQPRYHEFKAGADYIHGEFKTGRSMQVLSVHRPTYFNAELGLNLRSYFHNNVLVPGISSKEYRGVPVSFLFVDPAVTNEVVEVNYDGTEKTDPFRISTRFSVQYITDMSVAGMPRV